MFLTEDEFKNYMGFNPSLKKFDLKPVDVSDLDAKDLPDSVDWRKLGAVTAVKNQVIIYNRKLIKSIFMHLKIKTNVVWFRY